MKICGRVFDAGLLGRIQEAIDANPLISRRALSLQVCDWLNWKSRNGKPKEMSCRVALLRMHRKKLIRLPSGKDKESIFPHGKVRTGSMEFATVECSLIDLGSVEIFPIDAHDALRAKVKTKTVTSSNLQR